MSDNKLQKQSRKISIPNNLKTNEDLLSTELTDVEEQLRKALKEAQNTMRTSIRRVKYDRKKLKTDIKNRRGLKREQENERKRREKLDNSKKEREDDLNLIKKDLDIFIKHFSMLHQQIKRASKKS